ncbi:phosphoethanolamine transferase [[Pseudomonas] boreopolis]|uniref:phosphoethanolamine transferase n=1 Tax=Xanthomonas boreopolis TaxID=86183 RepID=UPI003DA180D7
MRTPSLTSPAKAIAGRLAAFRPTVSQESLAVASGVLFATFYNTAFFQAARQTGAFDGWPGTMAATSLWAIIAASTSLLLGLVLIRPAAKPLLAAVVLLAAACSYYMGEYTVHIDDDMMRNILRTDLKEASELATWSFAGHLLIYGLLPAVLLWRLNIPRLPLLRSLARRAALIGLAVTVMVLSIVACSQQVFPLLRNHKDLRSLITPGNALVALGRVAFDRKQPAREARTPAGIDARVLREPHARPRLLVIVVGETVRAQNWGMNGYARQTTPKLAALSPFNFSDVTACGTSTEVALPCMFSLHGRHDYDRTRIEGTESVLHVLDRAGIPVMWRDNQTGCKGVCEGLPFESFRHEKDPAHCVEDTCYDDILLRNIDGLLDALEGDAVLVLHQLGNHGPNYAKRYPGRFGAFEPACRSADLSRCSRDEIVNAYDNAIAFTDDVLARLIARLSKVERHATAMLYVSDHGESLGERGIYLHGMPYAIAPEEQKKVPMALWMSPAFGQEMKLSPACVRERAALPASHDNLSHTILGLMRIETRDYLRHLDLLAACTL